MELPENSIAGLILSEGRVLVLDAEKKMRAGKLDDLAAQPPIALSGQSHLLVMRRDELRWVVIDEAGKFLLFELRDDTPQIVAH